MERGQLARRSDFENRAAARGAIRVVTVGPTIECCPVEIAVGSLHYTCLRQLAVSAVGSRTKAVERGQFPTWSDFENCAPLLTVGPTVLGCPIEISVDPLNERPSGVRAFRPTEMCQSLECLCWRGTHCSGAEQKNSPGHFPRARSCHREFSVGVEFGFAAYTREKPLSRNRNRGGRLRASLSANHCPLGWTSGQGRIQVNPTQ